MVLTLNEQLKTHGYAIAKNLLSEEDLAEVTAVTDEMIKRWQSGEVHDEDFWSAVPAEFGKRVLYRIHNLEQKHPCIERVLELPRFFDLVRSVLGDGAAPTACALVVKMPVFGVFVRYHCDPVDVDYGTVYNFSIFLDDSTRENGCFEVVPGSHRLPPRVGFFEERPEGIEFVPAKRGDVVIHDVRVVHGSSLSRSQNLRRSICVEFRSADTLARPDLSAQTLQFPAHAF